MVSFISGFSDAALLFGLVQAAAIKQQGISPLRPSDILSYMPFACYAVAVLCVSLYIHLGPSKKTVMCMPVGTSPSTQSVAMGQRLDSVWDTRLFSPKLIISYIGKPARNFFDLYELV
jgi:hypothetical protein